MALATLEMDSISLPITFDPKRTIPTRMAAFVDFDHFNVHLLSHWNSTTIVIGGESGFW